MRLGAKISTGLFVLGGVIFLLQLWFSLWSAAMFAKILITIAVLLILSLVLTFLFKEAEDSARLKNDNDL